jgi:hypothetical protein
LRSNKNHDLFAHDQLLSPGNRINVLLILYHEIITRCVTMHQLLIRVPVNSILLRPAGE